MCNTGFTLVAVGGPHNVDLIVGNAGITLGATSDPYDVGLVWCVESDVSENNTTYIDVRQISSLYRGIQVGWISMRCPYDIHTMSTQAQ